MNFAKIEMSNDMGIAFDKRAYTQSASVFVPRLPRERVSRASIKGEAHELILDDELSLIFPYRLIERAKYPTNSRVDFLEKWGYR